MQGRRSVESEDIPFLEKNYITVIIIIYYQVIVNKIFIKIRKSIEFAQNKHKKIPLFHCI